MSRVQRARLSRYWWGLGWETRASVAAIAMSVIALGGFLAVSWIGTSDAAGVAARQTYVPLTTTVTKVSRLKEHGAVVVRRVPVTERIYAKPVTVQETRTLVTPSGTKVVTRPVVRYQPVYRKQIVTVDGRPVTVNRVVTNTRMLTDTQMLTVTNERASTVVQQETVNQTQTVNQTIVRTETSPPDTVTVTAPGNTVTETVATTFIVTVTMPVVTVTIGG
jgi:hypothetical protein